MTTAVECTQAARAAVDERLRRFPGHPLFLYAAREIARIEAALASSAPVDRSFYDGLTIGLMCARELEASDMPFCDIVHAMLEAIRRDTVTSRRRTAATPRLPRP